MFGPESDDSIEELADKEETKEDDNDALMGVGEAQAKATA